MRTRHLLLLTRLGLAVAVAAACALLFGPYQGIEGRVFLSDKEAHVVGFYGLSGLVFLAFPRSRRGELSLALLVLAAGSEIVQGFVGRDADLKDVAADAFGVIAVNAPSWAERVRGLCRTPPNTPLLQAWRAMDRRRARGTAPAPRETGRLHAGRRTA